jgi:hypothetical protein
LKGIALNFLVLGVEEEGEEEEEIIRGEGVET